MAKDVIYKKKPANGKKKKKSLGEKIGGGARSAILKRNKRLKDAGLMD